MKKLLLAFLLIVPMASAFADDDPAPATEPCSDGNCFVSANYVKGAYNALDSAKQAKLGSSNVTTTGTGTVVTSVTANNGEVTVTRSNVTIPNGQNNPTVYSPVWIE